MFPSRNNNDKDMQAFCNVLNLKNLVKEPTCFKNIHNPSCIDLILTNRHRSFQHTHVVEVGLSDFHKLVVTVLKTSHRKLPPKIISYRDDKRYCPNKFRYELKGRRLQFKYELKGRLL